MGQCMVVSAVFEPRGRSYVIDSTGPNSVESSGAADSQRLTVFSPRTNEPLRRKGKIILAALLNHVQEESSCQQREMASPIQTDRLSYSDDRDFPLATAASSALAAVSPSPLFQNSHSIAGSVSNQFIPGFILSNPNRASSSGTSTPSSTKSQGTFPSLALSRDEHLASAVTAKLSQQSKIYTFSLMTNERQAQLAALFQLDVSFILPCYAHFLHACRHFSPIALEYVLSEQQLSTLLRPQLTNSSMINRFFHIFSRSDAFGMVFQEFLMVWRWF